MYTLPALNTDTGLWMVGPRDPSMVFLEFVIAGNGSKQLLVKRAIIL